MELKEYDYIKCLKDKKYLFQKENKYNKDEVWTIYNILEFIKKLQEGNN